MKKISLALAISIGFAISAVHAADYNSDLIIGFTAEIGNDFEYDLGSPSSITNGQTWDLSSSLVSFDLAGVKWGVIGSDAIAKKAYATKALGLPPTLNTAGAANQDLAVQSIYSVFPDAGSGQNVAVPIAFANSWYQQTVFGPLTTSYKNAYLNPNTLGVGSIPVYRISFDGSAPILYGTFSLAANGIVTFTTPSTAPPAPTLNINRIGNISSISFLSANSATYTLLFTNSLGLATSVSNWPAMGGTITGDGTVKTFTDTTSDGNRVYGVKAQ